MSGYGSGFRARPKVYQLVTAFLAILIMMGCARGRDTDNLYEDPPPPMPAPEAGAEIPDTPVEDTLVKNTAECAQYWDPQILYQMLVTAFYYGGYDPLFYDPYSSPYFGGDLRYGDPEWTRGFRAGQGNGSRGIACANTLMQNAAAMNPWMGYYQSPSVLSGWLGSLIGWAYGGYGYGQTPPPAWASDSGY